LIEEIQNQGSNWKRHENIGVEIFFFLSLFFFLSRFSPLYPYYASLFFLSIPLFSFLFFLSLGFLFSSLSLFFFSLSLFLFLSLFSQLPPFVFIGKTKGGGEDPLLPLSKGYVGGAAIVQPPRTAQGVRPLPSSITWQTSGDVVSASF
jgi:hypothetical protein